jgi:hypothetical protein
MALPRTFKHLLEIELKDVGVPDYMWITYAVCATERDSCGWTGWMIEAAFKKTGTKHPTGTGDKVLPAVMDQVCPRCGRTTFRTAASIRMAPSEDQTAAHADAECLPIEYDDEG